MSSIRKSLFELLTCSRGCRSEARRRDPRFQGMSLARKTRLVNQKLEEACTVLRQYTTVKTPENVEEQESCIMSLLQNLINDIPPEHVYSGNLLQKHAIIKGDSGRDEQTTLLQEVIKTGSYNLLNMLLRMVKTDLNREYSTYGSYHVDKAPLVTACIFDPTGGELVRTLVLFGADLWHRSPEPIRHIPARQERLSGIEGILNETPVFYTLARDDPGVFMMLWKLGLCKQKDVSEHVTRAAITLVAVKCLKEILNNQIAPADAQSIDKFLYLASVTDFKALMIFLDGGFILGESFFRSYPDILARLYSRHCSRPSEIHTEEGGCEALTKVLIYSCQKIGGPNLVDKETFVALLERFRFNKILKYSGKQLFFKDICDTAEILIQENPNLIQEAPDSIEFLLKIWSTKYAGYHLGLYEATYFAGMAIKLIDSGFDYHCVGQCFLVTLFGIMKLHLSQTLLPITKNEISSFTELIFYALCAGCDPNMSDGGKKTLLLSLWGAAAFHTEGQNFSQGSILLVTSVISVMSKAGYSCVSPNFPAYDMSTELRRRRKLVDPSSPHLQPLPWGNGVSPIEASAAANLSNHQVSYYTTYLESILRCLSTLCGDVDHFLLLVAYVSVKTKVHLLGRDVQEEGSVRCNYITSVMRTSFKHLHYLSSKDCESNYVRILAYIFKGILQRTDFSTRKILLESIDLQRCDLHRPFHVTSFSQNSTGGDVIIALSKIVKDIIQPDSEPIESLKRLCRLTIIQNLREEEEVIPKHRCQRKSPLSKNSTLKKLPIDCTSNDIYQLWPDAMLGVTPYHDQELWVKLVARCIYPPIIPPNVAKLPLPPSLLWYVGCGFEEEILGEVYSELEKIGFDSL